MLLLDSSLSSGSVRPKILPCREMKGRDTPIQISVSSFLGFTEMLVGHYFELRPFGTEYVDSISPAMSLQILPSRSLCTAKVRKKKNESGTKSGKMFENFSKSSTSSQNWSGMLMCRAFKWGEVLMKDLTNTSPISHALTICKDITRYRLFLPDTSQSSHG